MTSFFSSKIEQKKYLHSNRRLFRFHIVSSRHLKQNQDLLHLNLFNTIIVDEIIFFFCVICIVSSHITCSKLNVINTRKSDSTCVFINVSHQQLLLLLLLTWFAIGLNWTLYICFLHELKKFSQEDVVKILDDILGNNKYIILNCFEE